MEDVPYARILREGWMVVLILAVLGGLGAYGITQLLPKTYASSATLMLQVDSAEASLFERNQFSLARIQSYPELVDSPDVIDGVRSDEGLPESEYSDRELRRMLTAENTTGTVLLVVRADAPTAELSAGMANSAASRLAELIEETENADSDDRYEVIVPVVLPANEPAAPISPQTVAITGLGVIGAAAVGGIIAVIRTLTSRRIRTASDIRRISGLPVIGSIPRASQRWRRGRGREARRAALEDLVGNLAVLSGAGRRRVMLVVTTVDGIDERDLRGILDAHGSAGRASCMLDTRDPAFGAPTGSHDSLDALLTEVRGGRSFNAGELRERYFSLDQKLPSAQMESELPTVIRQMNELDDVFVVISPSASGLIEQLSTRGFSLVVVVKRGATGALDLVSVVTRASVMGIRAIGAVVTGDSARSVKVLAQTWSSRDRRANVANSSPSV